MPEAIRLLGDGYEPHVDERDGALTYSFPVDSGFVSMDFSFGIGRADLGVLLADPYRRAVLEIVAHTVLQRSMPAGNPRVTQAAFDDVVQAILHASAGDLEDYIDRMSREHHIALRVYITEIMQRRSAGDRA